ncbi:hypothetical protein [Shewanella sp. NIFS-20-20]|uniref:hypothetical protein n=1 Tax=Shewanella sp. NIFS-20-20 TaxID=2853806 RepID=UPI001C475F6E|nr:hypothetical protein [Shewanella sp. NIFS-20-20]MBV7317329.1 hypothetical protein [Shewanella sp. NIFS-20-20]
MSQIEVVINQACQLAQAGKTPTLALIKSKVKLPMPILVQGLQAFKQLNAQERQQRLSQAQPLLAPQAPASDTLSLEQQLAYLRSQQQEMQTTIDALHRRVSQLEQQQ